MKRKHYFFLLLIAAIISSFNGCGTKEDASENSGKKDVSILIAAAASMEDSLEKSIIPLNAYLTEFINPKEEVPLFLFSTS